jgi:Helicase associated domain
MSNLRRVDSAKWKAYFEALKVSKEHNGQGKIVAEKRPGLGTWVKSQRTSFRGGKMNSWRIQMLNSIGFVWKVTGEACSPPFGSDDDDDDDERDGHNQTRQKKKTTTAHASRRVRRLGVRKRSKNDVTNNEEETAFVADGYDDEYEDEDCDDDDELGFPWWSPDESVCKYAPPKPAESSEKGTSLQQECPDKLQTRNDENSDQKETIQTSLVVENAKLRRWHTMSFRLPPRPLKEPRKMQSEIAVLQSEVDALSTQQSKLVALRRKLAAVSTPPTRFRDERKNQAKIEELRAELKSIL